jgi:hypothetical protein
MYRAILYHTPPPPPPYLDIINVIWGENIKKGMQNKIRIRKAIKKTEIKRVKMQNRKTGINLVGGGGGGA